MNISTKATEAAKLSHYVYRDSVARQLRREGYMAVKFCDNDGVQVICCVKDNIPYIIFRGVQSDTDVAPLLKFWYVADDAHAEIGARAKRVAADIDQWVRRNTITEPIVLAGHSLGGATALLYADYTDYDIDYILTFGAPKVGNTAFARRIDTSYRHIRYEKTNDAITYYPLLFLAHSGVPAYFDEHDRMHIDPSRIDKIKMISAGVWEIVKNCYRVGNYSGGYVDHNAAKYSQIVRAAY